MRIDMTDTVFMNLDMTKALMRVLIHLELSREAVEMICILLKTENQMSKMVDFIEANSKVNETQILEKAIELQMEVMEIDKKED